MSSRNSQSRAPGLLRRTKSGYSQHPQSLRSSIFPNTNLSSSLNKQLKNLQWLPLHLPQHLYRLPQPFLHLPGLPSKSLLTRVPSRHTPLGHTQGNARSSGSRAFPYAAGLPGNIFLILTVPKSIASTLKRPICKKNARWLRKFIAGRVGSEKMSHIIEP